MAQQRTYPDTSYICSCLVQEGYHMPPFRYSALETGIECVAGEEGERGRLSVEIRMRSIVVYQGLEARSSADWFCRP
jgi:hypothetical protein